MLFPRPYSAPRHSQSPRPAGGVRGTLPQCAGCCGGPRPGEGVPGFPPHTCTRTHTYTWGQTAVRADGRKELQRPSPSPVAQGLAGRAETGGGRRVALRGRRQSNAAAPRGGGGAEQVGRCGARAAQAASGTHPLGRGRAPAPGSRAGGRARARRRARAELAACAPQGWGEAGSDFSRALGGVKRAEYCKGLAVSILF
jgi:hypothetical protein